MKRISALLFCSVLASLVYAQSVEIETVIPASPALVVDQLRVLGDNTTSTVGAMNIGVLNSEPFQEQSLSVYGSGSQISSYLSANRDLFIKSPTLTVNTVNVGSSNLFTPTKTFNNIKGGTFRAQKIAGPKTTGTMKINKLSTEMDMFTQGTSIANPFSLGSVVSKRKIAYTAETQSSDANKKKYHIYFPWQDLGLANPTVTTCNSDRKLCTKSRCDVCTSGNPGDTCYDVRSRNLPASYETAGATYEKIQTSKFYCKPKDSYASNGNLTSICAHYVFYSGRSSTKTNNADIYVENFTGNMTSPFDGINTTNNIAGNSSPAEKCNAICGNGGCNASQAQEYFVAIDVSDPNGPTIVNYNTVFNETCQNAGTSWPQGSGLSCKANERIIDVYVLKCYKGSGKLARAAGTYYQKRKVLCQQYDTVYNNGGHDYIGNINNKYFFYPDFAVSYTAAYDATMASEAYPHTGYSY